MSSKISQQWATFGRMWYLINAYKQSPGHVAFSICPILQGIHKPIYHPTNDCGDHVVVYNTRHIALLNDKWVTKHYFHHTGYPGGASLTPAYEVHTKDPTKIIRLAIYGMLPKNLTRRTLMQRLHLFPDEDIPNDILDNITEQIIPHRQIPKALHEYTEEERAAFPQLFIPKDTDFERR